MPPGHGRPTAGTGKQPLAAVTATTTDAPASQGPSPPRAGTNYKYKNTEPDRSRPPARDQRLAPRPQSEGVGAPMVHEHKTEDASASKEPLQPHIHEHEHETETILKHELTHERQQEQDPEQQQELEPQRGPEQEQGQEPEQEQERELEEDYEKEQADGKPDNRPTVVEMCGGCGGLALASRQLGYRHCAIVEANERCVNTLRANGFEGVHHSRLEDFDWKPYRGTINLLTGGLPCQPWSIGGQDTGEQDARNLWREAVRAVKEIEPNAFLFEMVAGFLRDKFTPLREQLLTELSGLGYLVEVHDTDAKYAGLPQSRRRCFITGHQQAGSLEPPERLPQVTLKQALGDLGEPVGRNRHALQGPAREYPGHLASQWEGLAHTLRAGKHGPGGGNNAVRLPSGEVRYFTVREMARIQGFPDDYEFDPVWSHAVSELGNACPPALARPWLQALSRKWYPHSTRIAVGATHPTEGEPLAGAGLPLSGDGDPCEPPSALEAEEARFTKRALDRQTVRVHALAAQLWVLQRMYGRLLRDAVRDDDKDQSATRQAIARVAESLEDEAKEALTLAATSTVDKFVKALGDDERRSRLPRDGEGDPDLAADTVLQMYHLGRELKQASAWSGALASSLESSPVKSAQSRARDAYLHALDTTPVDDLDGAEFSVWNVETDQPEPSGTELPKGKKVVFRVPRSLLHEPLDADVCAASTDEGVAGMEDVRPFFNNIMSAESEDGIKYQSLKAAMTLEGADDQRIDLRGVVDSGAAWCALRESVLKTSLPGLIPYLTPSRMRFHDASGKLMSLVGRVPLAVWVGGRRLITTAYVFRDLGTEFLLGANALLRNGCHIDCNLGRLYVDGDPSLGVPMVTPVCPGCELPARSSHQVPEWLASQRCRAQDGSDVRLSCDASAGVLRLSGDDDRLIATVDCHREPAESARPKANLARLQLEEEYVIEPGEVVRLALHVRGRRPDRIVPAHMKASPALEQTGLTYHEEVYHNITGSECIGEFRNDTDAPVVMPAYVALFVESTVVPPEEDTVLVAAVLAPTDELDVEPPPLDDGGIEFLEKRGFSLKDAIDPDRRREDGSYEPLSEEKKRVLYKIALRWHYVFSADAKVPRISYLVVIDIPTGDAAPVAQAPYPIPAKLRSAAMAEINKLLKAGLIEYSMSDWASPALVRVKKDSTSDEIKIKFAIDYRRVNAVTVGDAGGLGTQADILYGVGGKYKYLGLCDAAGGFYQFLLSPRARHKSAFILPAAMGGTLFQWRVAPYGLTRNPAGYSRGMQWALRGLHDVRGIGDGLARGGATSWLDDICMRSTSFDSFAEVFNTVLSRMAMAGMSLKGSKCELLHEKLDLLGFVATPHGLMMQVPKLDDILKTGVPSTSKEAMTFLGAVAFLRRMVPRISLLSAPMTAAVVSCKKRNTALGHGSRRGRTSENFNDAEQADVTASWQAIVEHLDRSAVLAPPDFDDPLAHFAICTDASDFAVGGVLMQWQHPDVRGPGPPAGSAPDSPKSDPLDSAWRKKAGWELKVINYYSKTLNDAQKHYPAFDKEAGGALLCCRQWADLITHHPTTLYTDSAVAATMLTKHAAPPRLQRWGMELGAFLPHLRIGYRKGADNGLADLLSRYPAFKRFTSCRSAEDCVDLPDDYFDYIGDAPLYHRIPSTPRELHSATYKLYEPKHRSEEPESFWHDVRAPEIPGRGMTDRVPKVDRASTGLDPVAINCLVAGCRRQDHLAQMIQELRQHVEDCGQPDDSVGQSFLDQHARLPRVAIAGQPGSEVGNALALVVDEANCLLVGVADEPDVMIDFTDGPVQEPSDCYAVRVTPATAAVLEPDGSDEAPGASVRLGGRPFCVTTPRPFGEVRAWCGDADPNRGAAELMTHCLQGVMDARRPSPPDEPATAEGPRRAPRRFDWQDGALEDDEAVRTLPTEAITAEEQLKDPQLRIMIDALRGSVRVPRAQRLRVVAKYELADDCLYRIVLVNGEPGRAVVVPSHMRSAVLARAHYSLVDGGGHVGGQTMADQLRVDHYWPGMETECHAFAAACETCGGTRSQGTIGGTPGVSPTPSAPFQVIHIDHKGPMPRSGGFTSVLVVVCALTKFTLYIPVKDQTAKTTLRALQDHVFAIFGNPLVIISDNGGGFHNHLMKAAQHLYGYRHIYVCPHTPEANGLAEAAVKKLKITLDRHTRDYADWHYLVGPHQAMVNQRLGSSPSECPFANLFGRAPTTLAALEDPNLLPASTPEEKDIRALGDTLARIHRQLKSELDAAKEAGVAADQAPTNRRQVQPGDKIWLTYSDSERARYIRKHGHGRAWRHPFVVEVVKPHKVRLTVPRDGTVPDVLPWQSLRKCAFAAPHFHDDHMPLPTTDERGTPIVPDAHAQPAAPPAADEATPEDDELHIIEKIVSAEKFGRGWRLRVKWEGFDDVTPEPLSKILQQVDHPDILKQITECQERHLAGRPDRTAEEAPLVPAPTRAQPQRDRRQASHFSFHVESHESADHPFARTLEYRGMQTLRRRVRAHTATLRQFAPDAYMASALSDRRPPHQPLFPTDCYKLA